MERLQSLANWLALAAGYLAAIALFIMAIGVTADVLSRNIFGVSSEMAVEVSGYLLVVLVFLGLGYTHLKNGHIRIDLFLNMLPSRVIKAVNVVNALLFIGYSAVLALLGFRSAWTSYRFGTTSRTIIDVTVWPIQVLIPIGLTVLIVLLLFDPWRIIRSRSATGAPPPERLHD